MYFYSFPFSIAYCAYTFIFSWTLDAIVLYSHAPLLSELVVNSFHALCHLFSFWQFFLNWVVTFLALCQDPFTISR